MLSSILGVAWAVPAAQRTAAAPTAAEKKAAPPKRVSPCLPAPPSTVPSVFRDCADTPEMVRLQGGKFLMGEQGANGKLIELPVHEVTVKPFAIGRFEVTFIEWMDCVDDGGCSVTPDDNGWGKGFRPVININWFDAQEYVAWLSKKTGRRYRLPTEAEWEYAARGGTDTTWGWGDASGEACEYSNSFDASGQTAHANWFWNIYCDDGFVFTAPVGSFKPNAFGLYDMPGNVWEWLQDCWHPDYNGAPADGSAWIQGGDCNKRVNRGGGWGNHPRTTRSANRDADMPYGRGDAFGLRVVREIDPSLPVPAPAPEVAAPAN
ncbi:MAG TPA: formylglycine-generating enzyme family protein [Nevskiaceae bacterium]|nr:formylglycine-generating enzyme family protein [Nevskiaceae bacterium]